MDLIFGVLGWIADGGKAVLWLIGRLWVAFMWLPGWIRWFIIAPLLAWGVLVNAYVAGMHAKQVLKQHRDEISWVFLGPVLVLAVIGVVLDCVFNYTIGCILYREPPRWGEWLFSARTQRQWRQPTRPANKDMALWWAIELNRWDPSPHIVLD